MPSDFLDERAEQLRLEFEACPVDDRDRLLTLDRQVSQWISHGRITDQQREKMLETFYRKDALLRGG
jgi:hypothetical protein